MNYRALFIARCFISKCKCVDGCFSKEEENERNAAMLSALGTFFKQIGYANNTSNLLERYPSFNTKDKSKFPMFSSKSNKKVKN